MRAIDQHIPDAFVDAPRVAPTADPVSSFGEHKDEHQHAEQMRRYPVDPLTYRVASELMKNENYIE